MARPIVAIVGRPNVGKSTLFNRLMGAKLAVVDQTPGTTRDRLYGGLEWRGRAFDVVDTGGLGLEQDDRLQQSIVDQAETAIREADVIVFITDIRDGPVPLDVDVANRLRRSPKPVILAANKADNPRDRGRAVDFHELGLGDPVALSSIQGIGTGDLLDQIVEELPPTGDDDAEETEIGIAIVGRPNVGKSSLLNAIVGEQRAIVDAVAGTTRDAIDTIAQYGDRRMRLIDTAGIRRRGRIEQGIEAYSVLRAMRAIERADIAIVVIDAVAGVAAQDAHVAGYIHEAAKGCILAVNKWDLVHQEPRAGDRYRATIRRELAFLDYAPIVFVSAATKLHVRRLLDGVLAIEDERERRVPTAELNEFVRSATASHPLTDRGRALKVLYATQASVRPPTFVLFVNEPSIVHFSYRRYLENQIRRRYGFDGTGIRIVFRGK